MREMRYHQKGKFNDTVILDQSHGAGKWLTADAQNMILSTSLTLRHTIQMLYSFVEDSCSYLDQYTLCKPLKSLLFTLLIM